ncbi:hypothetical protein AA0242T_1535 [Acetobacter aceti NRIC 0242]|uniref:Uncharacterized protein n=2 Tax=Acetobacter aceti TaxID=435 RepID=A0AB33IHX3_ACEAC|nr:hypothetical protein EDC15_1172 [Acetobacter aceti NBRC 14818]BCK76715.1 hypothetical protein EMQ_2321 [Acetobacter aceti NBRC 14818]GBO80833.1 hypothetical protein AA0242T_1535 [Acetobacter aceti NRIC 0242]
MECEFMSNISRNASAKLEKNTSEVPVAYVEGGWYGRSSVADTQQAGVSSVSTTLSSQSSLGSEQENDFPSSSVAASGTGDLSTAVDLSISGEDEDQVASSSDEVATKVSSDLGSDESVVVFGSPASISQTLANDGSAVLKSSTDASAMEDQTKAQTVSSAADIGSLSDAVLPQASYGVPWIALTDSSANVSTSENAVATGAANAGVSQENAASLMASTDQSTTTPDTTEATLLSAVGTTDVSNQADNSSVSVTSTLSGANDIVVNNGVIALDGGTNTVVAQNDGTVSVWSAAGSTNFNDAGSGNAEFYVTGTGTFDVQDTGSGDATLKVIQTASSDASGTITGGARHLDVTTGSGAVSIVAGLGGLDLSTAGSGALQIDVTQGTDHILIAGDQTGNVTVSGAVVNTDANFGIMGVTSEQVINGNFVVGLTDGNSVTFLGAAGSDNITLYLA